MYRKRFVNIYSDKNFSFEEAKSEIDFVLETLFDYTYKDFITGNRLENWQTEKLLKIFEERTSTHRPIQQIIGRAYFYGRRFFVDENTLIPRPETELLVKAVLDIIQNMPNPKILDIGTGTGCIPVTIALENKNAKTDSVDISKEALYTARKNQLFHNVFSNVNFIRSDLFENVNDKYDVIVSNPPYIPIKNKETLQIEVKDFDPPLALFTKDELGVSFYENIIKSAGDYLTDGGFILFELGINQADIVKDFLKINNYGDIKIIKDFNSIDRVIIARK